MLRTQATSKHHGSICPFLKEHAHKSPSPKMAKDTKYARVLKTTLPPTKARKVVMLTPLRSVLQNNQEEIYCLDKILYGKNSWTHLSLIHDEIVINLQSTKVYVFSDSVLCLGKVLQHPESNDAWKNRVAGVRAERSYRDYDDVSGESTELEWNIFPDSQRCSSVIKSVIF